MKQYLLFVYAYFELIMRIKFCCLALIFLIRLLKLARSVFPLFPLVKCVQRTSKNTAWGCNCTESKKIQRINDASQFLGIVHGLPIYLSFLALIGFCEEEGLALPSHFGWHAFTVMSNLFTTLCLQPSFDWYTTSCVMLYQPLFTWRWSGTSPLMLDDDLDENVYRCS